MYARQNYAIKRSNKVLGVDVHLALPPVEKVQSGDMNAMEDVGYSRFILTIVDKTGRNVIYPYANIPAGDISYIKSMKDIALQHKVLSCAAAPESETDLFVTRIPFGNYKGKTIMEIAAGASDPKEVLMQQRKILQPNAATFKLNNVLIKDIDTLLEQIEDGTFDPSGVKKSASIITVYEQNYKALRSRRDSENRAFVYSILMTCNLGMKYSWEVTVKNGYAPLKEAPNGALEVQVSGMVGQTQSSMKMTDSEFCGLIDNMFFNYRDFKSNTFMDQYDIAQELDYAAMKKSTVK